MSDSDYSSSDSDESPYRLKQAKQKAQPASKKRKQTIKKPAKPTPMVKPRVAAKKVAGPPEDEDGDFICKTCKEVFSTG